MLHPGVKVRPFFPNAGNNGIWIDEFYDSVGINRFHSLLSKPSTGDKKWGRAPGTGYSDIDVPLAPEYPAVLRGKSAFVILKRTGQFGPAAFILIIS